MGEDIRVLIVEDELIIAQDLRMLLKAEGYDVVGIADNGKDAIGLANYHSPHVVLMDIKLKGKMDGVQAAESLKRTKGFNIVFLTSSRDPDLLARAEGTNPHRILAKFNRRELLETLSRLRSTFQPN